MDNKGSLNAYFQPSDSIPAQPSNFGQDGKILNQVDINGKITRSAITGMHLKNFSFNSGTGGTITLGGLNNGNGLMIVKDAGGTTRVTADNTGITITDGNLTFINSAGGTVLDSTGLVSVTSFPNDSAFNGTAGLSTTSTSFVNITGGSLSPFVLDRTSRILISLMAFGENGGLISSDSNYQVEVQVVDSFDNSTSNIVVPGGAVTNVTVPGGTLNFTMTTFSEMVARSFISDYSAGTHSFYLQYRAINGGTANIDAWSIDYLILGS